MKRAKRGETYLHYGDAAHTPMQTVRFRGTARELAARIKEAKDDGWPLRVQVVAGSSRGRRARRKKRG